MILLADDNPETRKHIALLLTNDRFPVVEVADGREALWPPGSPRRIGAVEDLRTRHLGDELLPVHIRHVQVRDEERGHGVRARHQIDKRPGRAGGIVGSFVKPIYGEKATAFLALVAQHAHRGELK